MKKSAAEGGPPSTSSKKKYLSRYPNLCGTITGAWGRGVPKGKEKSKAQVEKRKKSGQVRTLDASSIKRKMATGKPSRGDVRRLGAGAGAVPGRLEKSGIRGKVYGILNRFRGKKQEDEKKEGKNLHGRGGALRSKN